MNCKLMVVINVMRSLVTTYGWIVTRFDVMSFDYGEGIEEYRGYLDCEGHTRLYINSDGSFTYNKED